MAASNFLKDLLRQLEDALFPTWAEGWQWRPRPTNADYERSVVASGDALAAVRGTGDWRAVPSLLYLLAHDNVELRKAAATVISELAPFIPAAALPGFECRVRVSTWNAAYSWRNLQLDWVVKQEWPPLVWAIFTMHCSGYVREAALRQLIAAGDAALALPYLLLRINDWVDQVHTVATSAVKSLLASKNAAMWAPVLGLIDQLRVRSREDHSWLTDAVTSILLLPQTRSELRKAATSGDRSVARWAFRAAMTLPEPDRAMFVSLALANGDPVVRLHAAQAIRAWRGCPGREQLLLTMASDSFVAIRREALYSALEDTPEHRRAVLLRALLDRHASMRHAARFYLRERQEQTGEVFDIRGFYIAALSDGDPMRRAAAILGVGECGTPADADGLAQFVSDDRPKVAAAAVRAVAALDRDYRVDWLIALLCNDRPSVAREAAWVLESLGNLLPVEGLRHVLDGDFRPHCRRYALRILLRRHPYDAIVDAVTAAGSGDASLVRTGTDFIEKVTPWRVRYSPSEAQKALLQSAIQGLSAPLPGNLRRRLREFMGVGQE